MMSAGLRVLYLHGFASSPRSRKAQFFAERLRSSGIRLEIPDLAEGDFCQLTITSQLEVLKRTLAGAPALLIGSSLGGYLAALYASLHAEVARVILLAPAFDVHRLWSVQLGRERVAEWEANGTMLVFHHRQGREVPLNFQFLADAGRYDAYPSFSQPALIFHGNRDPVVPVEHSVRFQAAHPAARLVRLDSEHELTDVLETLWLEAQSFLLTGLLREC